MNKVSRILAVVAPLLFVHAAQAADPQTPLEQSFDLQVKPFLKRYCVRCHNADKRKSGVRVDHLQGVIEDEHLRVWEALRKQMSEAAMPPANAAQPTAEQRKQMVEWIDRALESARLRPAPKNGLVRRLTVAQYRNTLRELLLLEENLTEMLPPDAVSRDGFVNNTETLQLSPLLLEAYLEIAEKALQRSIVDTKTKPTIQNFRVELGAGINAHPCPDKLILGADSLLLNNADFVVTQPRQVKPFDFDPFVMRTKYRFIEGYQGNDTVRGWREFDSIYHAVYACMRGAHGYPKGRAYETIPQGLLLRPAIPSAEIFGVDSTYGPRANFKIAVRELPDRGRFRVKVTAARYNDGLLLDRGTASQPRDGANALVFRGAKPRQTIEVKQAGIYQVDVYTAHKDKTPELILSLGERQFTGALTQPAFLVARLPAGKLAVNAHLPGGLPLDRMVFTPLAETQEIARRFLDFENRVPLLGVHMGFRRDCGSTLAPVGSVQTVSNEKLSCYVFEGSLRNYPNPDVEKDNVNYLAGIREFGVRSEYTDGRDRPRLLIRSVEFEGPYHETWPPPSHRNIFLDTDQKDNPLAHGRKVLHRFATRAYRRPITPQEENTLVEVFKKSLDRGSSFQESVKEALHVALASPQFLFLIENSHTPEAEPLDDYELASKLSYFLWKGPPDTTTLKLAEAGLLRKKLDAEVERMIESPKFARFAAEFASQWLSLDKFQVLEPNRKRFPKLTRQARAHLRQEPVQFLHYSMRNNLPVRNLIDTDFVMANEVTAGYYDLVGKTASGLEFVPVRHGRRDLGGLLSQAAILAGLSDGREANPVKRGAWLARKIIAEPPDDPPPNVPALKEDTRLLPLRQRLERHRSQSGCAQCHAKIDPWGVPFEEFDAGGRFKRELPDARSTLPDKTEISGVASLKRYLAKDRIDQVAFSVLKHLATYAAGRSLTYRELEQLKKDAVKLKAKDYRLKDMIRFVVHSPMFLEK
jgi:cytochrome c553